MLSNILKKNDSTAQARTSTPLEAAPAPESTPTPTTNSYRSNSVTVSKTTLLTAETEFRGTLGFNGNLELHGRLEGSIESDNGLLTIGESALVKAEIKAQDIIICGKVQGNITATGRIELRGKAQIYGDIRAGRMLIEEGVTFVGRSESLHAKQEEKPDFSQIFTKLTPASETDSKSSLK